MGLLETAAATLIGGERRVASAARNVTNVNTPGYKREIAYAELAQPTTPTSNATNTSQAIAPKVATSVLSSQGSLVETGNPLDFAVNGSAMLLVRQGEQYFLTRGGQFGIGANGTLTDALGRIVQQAGGGDLELTTPQPEVLADGTVLDGDAPIGSLGLFDVEDANIGQAMTQDEMAGLDEAVGSELRQGMIESSNVELSDEMVTLMRSQRQIESGAQLVRAYDQLMSQAISTFSRSR